jgi:hypothetical protein
MRQRVIVAAVIGLAFAWSLVVRDRHNFRIHGRTGGMGLNAHRSMVVDEITVRQLKAWARECTSGPAKQAGVFQVQAFDYITPAGDEVTFLDVLVEDASDAQSSSDPPATGVEYVRCMGLR